MTATSAVPRGVGSDPRSRPLWRRCLASREKYLMRAWKTNRGGKQLQREQYRASAMTADSAIHAPQPLPRVTPPVTERPQALRR
jgi:hypothetical protein